MRAGAVRPAENIPAVLGRYALRPVRIELLSHKGHKAVWLVRTAEGAGLIVKKLPYERHEIDYMMAAIRHLRANGVRTPNALRSQRGKHWVRLNGEHYAVFEAVQGRKPKYEREQELAAIMRGMASFHKASAGFMPPNGHPPSRTPEDWKRTKLKQRARLAVWHSEAQRKAAPDEFDRLLARHGAALLAQCDASIAALNRTGLDRWIEETLRTGTLCHLDFAASNLVLTDEGLLHAIDLDTVAMEVPCVDIRKITNKVMRKRPAWDAAVMQRMLNWYQEVLPLTAERLHAVAADVMFPHLSYEQIEKYAARRAAGAADPALLRKVRRMIELDLSKVPELRRFVPS